MKIKKKRFFELMTQHSSVFFARHNSKQSLFEKHSHEEIDKFFRRAVFPQIGKQYFIRKAYKTNKELVFDDGSRLHCGTEADTLKEFYQENFDNYYVLAYHCIYESKDDYKAEYFLYYIVFDNKELNKILKSPY